MHALKPRQKVELLMQKGKAIPNLSLLNQTLLGINVTLESRNI